MIKVNNKDGSFYKNITDYRFDSYKYFDINEIEVEGDGDGYLQKVMYIYDNDILVGSGIVEGYTFDKFSNKSSIDLYPLYTDMRRGILHDSFGSVVFVNDDLSNVISTIVNQYRAETSNPLLYIKEIENVGITIDYSFSYQTRIEAFNFCFKFLKGDAFIKIDSDGGISVKKTGESKILNFGTDIKNIDYEKRTDEIINYIVFDNGISGPGHITGIYQDTTSIATYGQRVKYIKDGRMTTQAGADGYCNAFLDKNKNPKIVVNSISTIRKDINVYDKITINNREKNFDDNIYVNSYTYRRGGTFDLKLGNLIKRDVLIDDEMEGSSGGTSIENYLTAIESTIPTLPSYIKTTYIDSTEIKSPTFSGNLGRFSGMVRVGSEDGASLDAIDSNYRIYAGGTTPSTAPFSVQKNGDVKGNIFTNQSILFNKLGSTPSTLDGKMWCEGNPTNKVLRAYMGGLSGKQQVSMSSMILCNGFDRTGSGTTITETTRFQPRSIVFYGYFENVSLGKKGFTEGFASRLSFTAGVCNRHRHQDAYTDYTSNMTSINIYSSKPSGRYVPRSASCRGAVAGCYDITSRFDTYSYNVQTVRDNYQNRYFGTGSNIGNIDGGYVSIYPSSRSDTGVQLTVSISAGRRFVGNYFILG